MLVAQGEKGLIHILWNKGIWHYVFIERTCLLWQSIPPPFT